MHSTLPIWRNQAADSRVGLRCAVNCVAPSGDRVAAAGEGADVDAGVGLGGGEERGDDKQQPDEECKSSHDPRFCWAYHLCGALRFASVLSQRKNVASASSAQRSFNLNIARTDCTGKVPIQQRQGPPPRASSVTFPHKGGQGPRKHARSALGSAAYLI